MVGMLVMKFGGTSVGSPERMHTVVDLVASRAKKTGCVVVLSAMSGVTNALIEGANLANKRQLPKALDCIKTIKEKHVAAIDALFQDAATKTQLLEHIDKQLDELSVLYKGVSYLGELSKRSLDAISGVGELLSSAIVAALA